MKVIRDQKFITFCEMLGSNMRFCRLQTGMPQKSLAYHLGVSHQNVQKYEAGDIIPSAYRLKHIADFYKVKTDDLVDPTFIHRSTKSNELLDAAPAFDASKYEDFADEYPMPLTHLEHDPKMRATYDAILEDK